MCGSISGRNPLSSCKGPRLEDDVESFIVMPGRGFKAEKFYLVTNPFNIL